MTLALAGWYQRLYYTKGITSIGILYYRLKLRRDNNAQLYKHGEYVIHSIWRARGAIMENVFNTGTNILEQIDNK